MATNPSGVSDYPAPQSIVNKKEYIWDEDDLAINNYRGLGERLAAAGDLYRRPAYAGGLLRALARPDVEPVVIDAGKDLASIIVDRVRVRVIKGGNTRGTLIPAAHLDAMLHAEVFLQQFKAVDGVVRVPHFLPDFELLKVGYNDGGSGQRFLYVGPEPRVEASPEAIKKFLGAMAFASNADRSNTLAAALTVLLRNFWPGAKPLIAVTSTKSHAGKDTIVEFAAGTTPKLSIGYEQADWAFQKAFVAAIKDSPSVGVVNVENARVDRHSRFLESAFLERLLTEPEPLLYSPGTGPPVRRRNDLVVAVTTNNCTLGTDLMNRALPIRLAPRGNIVDRVSPIGNPKLEFLPANRERIEAELRGLVQRWKETGRPLDPTAKHAFSDWAATVGGILIVGGFEDFLANYSLRRTADDPLRKALGLLAAYKPDQWLRPAEWAHHAHNLSVDTILIDPNDRRSDQGRERGIGVVLSAHEGETFVVETEDAVLTLRLEKGRPRNRDEPRRHYRFTLLASTPLAADPLLVGDASAEIGATASNPQGPGTTPTT